MFAMEVNEITEIIIGAAIEVHKQLGPGLLESTYERCLIHEIQLRSNLDVVHQKILPITYKGIQLDEGYRLDLLVAEQVIVEVKAVEKILPVHEAQLMTYLHLTGLQVGLLLNFNVTILKNGIVRKINSAPKPN
jgi:GxxExxY protein